MTIHDYVWIVWLYMTIYHYVRLFMTMYDYLWLCVTMYDYVWLFITMFDFVFILPTFHDPALHCVTLCYSGGLCMILYNPLLHCMTMRKRAILELLPISTSTSTSTWVEISKTLQFSNHLFIHPTTKVVEFHLWLQLQFWLQLLL